MEENRNEKFEIEGRNAVMEAFRSGKTVVHLGFLHLMTFFT